MPDDRVVLVVPQDQLKLGQFLAKLVPVPDRDLAVPQEFKDRTWDYSKFGRGERFVYKQIPRTEFDEVMDQVKRWGLDQHIKERSFENLVTNAA